MPDPNPPVNESCQCCELCQYAGDNQLVYCHQGEWRTLPAPTEASTLGFDPVTGFQWVPVLGPNAATSKPSEGD